MSITLLKLCVVFVTQKAVGVNCVANSSSQMCIQRLSKFDVVVSYDEWMVVFCYSHYTHVRLLFGRRGVRPAPGSSWFLKSICIYFWLGLKRRGGVTITVSLAYLCLCLR